MKMNEHGEFLLRIKERIGESPFNVNIKHTNGHITTLYIDSDGNCELKKGFANETIIRMMNALSEYAYNRQEKD